MTTMSAKGAGFSRRQFLVVSLSAAGGLAIGLSLPHRANAASISSEPWDQASGNEVNAWILIEPDDTVVIRVAQSEMGRAFLRLCR